MLANRRTCIDTHSPVDMKFTYTHKHAHTITRYDAIVRSKADCSHLSVYCTELEMKTRLPKIICEKPPLVIMPATDVEE